MFTRVLSLSLSVLKTFTLQKETQSVVRLLVVKTDTDSDETEPEYPYRPQVRSCQTFLNPTLSPLIFTIVSLLQYFGRKRDINKDLEKVRSLMALT